jgi:hypothetical protein
MATNRSATNVFWSTMIDLADTELVTKALLYVGALHRLQDNAYYVLGKVGQVYADLVSQAAGGNAFSVGNVDLTLFNFDGGIALNGLTIIADEDTTTAETCTFGNTITSPALLLAALTSQAGTNKTWSLTSAGYLRYQSNTVGAGSTVAAPTGTAATALFGSASTTSPGSSSANDGASRIGVAAIGSLISAGTLRAALTALESAVTTATTNITNKVAKAGDTMTGGLTAPSLTVNNASNTVALTSRSVTRSDGCVVGYDDSDWVATSNGEMGVLVNTIATLPVEFYPPHGQTLNSVTISWQGTGGHAGLPATRPSVEVKRTNLTTGSVDTLGGPVNDPSASVVDYESIHDIAVTGINDVVDRSAYRYHVTVTSEGGANALAGAVYRGLRRASAVTRLDEG